MRTENLAIMFVDIAGFTSRTSSQSREENERMLRRFAEVVRPLVRRFSGRVVKEIGDAYLVTFRSPTEALHCAMAVHDALVEGEVAVPEAEQFEVRAAVTVGDVRVEGGDVFGEAVNIAARIESEAPAGEVWFSEAAYLSMTRSEVPAEEVGARSLKGIPQPVRLYRIPRAAEVGGYRLQGEAPGAAAAPGHPLAPAELPFGGHALTLSRSRTTRLEALAPLGRRGLTGLRALLARYRSSPAFRLRVRVAGVVLLAAVLVWGGWMALKPEPRPLTPLERFQRALGR